MAIFALRSGWLRPLRATALSALLGLSLLASAVAASRAEDPVPTADAVEYIVGVDDEISILAAGHMEITQNVRVLSDGKIYVGGIKEPIQAAGLSLTRLKAELQKGFGRLYNNLELSVTIKESLSQRVTIVGARTSGQYSLRKDMRVSTLLALAGGAPGKTKLLVGNLVRGAKLIPLKMDKIVGVKPEVEADLLLREGDMVILDQKEEPPPPRFSVLGAVAKGGTFDLPLDGTPVSIAQAVANAGGKNPNAALSKVVLQRKGEKIELNLYPLLGEGKADAPEGKYEMQDGDVLLIPEMQRKFMVMGAVNRPATYPLPEEKVVTVLQALSEAGGSAANANPGKATLLRMVNGKTELTKIDLYKMVAKGDTSKNFVIQDNDVLWVPVKGEKFNINEIINPLWLLNVMGISLFR